MTERVGPLIRDSESLETANPDECKFYAHLIFFYELRPVYDYPICLHPRVCQSDSPNKPFYRTEQIGCNLDNCPFIQKIEIGAFSELTLENLANEEIIQLPDMAEFHLAHSPFWVVPPPDFAERAAWGLFSIKEAVRIEELFQKIDTPGIVGLSAQAELLGIIRKYVEKERKKTKENDY